MFPPVCKINRYLSALLIATLGTYSQSTDKPLRVTTRLVQVGVVVHRGNGPATGLTKDDFQIFDNGKEQRIATFAGGDPSVVPTGSSPSAARPNVFSNRTDHSTAGITVVLFDALNTPPADMENVKNQVIRSLSQIEKNNSIALYALGARLVILHDFTADTAHLRQVLEQYRTGALHEISLNGATPAERQLDYTQRVFTTVSALQAIARHLQPIPGRKNLIWVSSSFPVIKPNATGSDRFRLGLSPLAREITEAGIAIYPVSTRGMANNTGLTAISSRTSGQARGGASSPALSSPTILALADETGGKAYYNTNDLATAVQHALSDSDATYLVGFYPAEETLDGKFHELKVKVRAKGTDVRYRRGYFATADVPLTNEQRDQEITAAVSSPLESTGVAMKVRVDPADQPKPGSLRLVVGIDLNTLTLAPKGDHHAGAVQLIMLQQASDGRHLTKTDEIIKLDLTPEEFARMTNDGLVLVKYLKPEPDAFQIRVFVLDTNSGALGSVFVPAANR
jgi:VWFA-related protein